VPQNRRGRSRIPSEVKILIAGSNTLLLPEQKYVQVQSSSVAQAAWDLELRDCRSIGYLSTDHFTMAALHLEAAPVSLFLCAVMLSAWFGGVGPSLLATSLSALAFYDLLPAFDSIRWIPIPAAKAVFMTTLRFWWSNVIWTRKRWRSGSGARR